MLSRTRKSGLDENWAFCPSRVRQKSETLLSNLPVEQAVVEDPVTVEPAAWLTKAARILIDQRTGCLALIEDG